MSFPKKLILINLFAAALFGAFVMAGTLDPASAPGDTTKTLEDIYCRYADCVPDSYGLDSPSAPDDTMQTLQAIYNIVDTEQYGRGWTPNPSGAGSTALTQAACEATTTWEWFEDGNGDGDTIDPEDGICVQVLYLGTDGNWNGNACSSGYENSYIAAYTCAGNFPSGYVATYSGRSSGCVADPTWNDGDCALCEADCYDGKKDLPDQGGWTAPNNAQSDGVQGPITSEVMKNWKGTRLPTMDDFYGFCGATAGDSETTAGDGLYHSSGASPVQSIGSYGNNVARGFNSAPYDEYIDLSNRGSYEWLSEPHYYYSAWIVGLNACSYFYGDNIYNSRRSRAVFRP